MKEKNKKIKSQETKKVDEKKLAEDKLYQEEVEKWKKKLVVNSKGKLSTFIIIGACVLGVAGGIGGHYAYKYIKQQETERNRCIVTFDTNDGNTVKVQINKGEKIQEPSAPSKDNYTFGGWYFDKEFKNKCNFPFVVNENITLYAKWRVTVSFNLGNGVIQTQVIDIGETTSIPEIPTQSGKKFAGWFASNKYEEKDRFYLYEPFNQNTTIYAKWVNESEYNIVTFACGNNYSYQKEVKIGEAINKPDDPSFGEYTFKAWCTDQSFTTQWDFKSTVTDDMTLYGSWNTDQKIMVTYYRTSTEFETREMQKGTRAENITPKKKPGYKFAYWCTDSDCQTKFDFNTELNESKILYAKWIEEDWLVTKDQFNKSFSYLVNVEEQKQQTLNYASTGKLQIIENEKELYNIKSLVIADDKEYFVNEKGESEYEYYYTQKQNDYYAYVKAESDTPSIGTFSYFDNYAIRDYIAEIFQNVYDKYEYFTISDDDKGYVYNYGKEGEEYYIHILLSFINYGDEKRINQFDCEYTHIDPTTKNSKTIWSHQNYSYDGQRVYMPGGNWQSEMENNVHTFNNTQLVTDNPIKAKGTHILSINKTPLNPLSTITAKQKGSGQDLVEVDFPADKNDIVIRINGITLDSSKYSIEKIGTVNKLKLTTPTVANDRVNILLDVKNEIKSDTYFYFTEN